jgi:hypothetical protein
MYEPLPDEEYLKHVMWTMISTQLNVTVNPLQEIKGINIFLVPRDNMY